MELRPNDKKIILIIIAAFLLFQTLIDLYSYSFFGFSFDFIKLIVDLMPSTQLQGNVRNFLMVIWIIPLVLTGFIPEQTKD